MSKKTDNSEERLANLESEMRRVLNYVDKANNFLERTETDASLNQARKAVEAICKQIYIKEGFNNKSIPAFKAPLDELIKRFREEINKGNAFMPRVILTHLCTIRDLGNLASHDQGEETGKITHLTGSNCLSILSEVVTWCFEEYHDVPLMQLDEKGSRSEAVGVTHIPLVETSVGQLSESQKLKIKAAETKEIDNDEKYYHSLSEVDPILPIRLQELFRKVEKLDLMVAEGSYSAKQRSRIVWTPFKVQFRDNEGNLLFASKFNFGIFKPNGYVVNRSWEGDLGRRYSQNLADILSNSGVIRRGGKFRMQELLSVEDEWFELIRNFLPELKKIGLEVDAFVLPTSGVSFWRNGCRPSSFYSDCMYSEGLPSIFVLQGTQSSR